MNNIDYTARAKEIITSHMLFANDYKRVQLASDLVNSSSFKCNFYYECVKNLQLIYICNEVYEGAKRKIYWDESSTSYIYFSTTSYVLSLFSSLEKIPDDFMVNISNILELACFI